MFKKEKGFTLIEFMVVIALMGMGLLFVLSQFKDGGDQNKSQMAIKNLAQLRSALSGLKDVRNGYSGINQSVVAKSSSAPSNMRVGANLVNVFGGIVAMSNVSAAAPWSNNYINVIYPSVPEHACVDIATKMLNSSVLTDPAAVGILIMTNGVGSLKAINTPALAATRCGASNNILVFRFP